MGEYSTWMGLRMNLIHTLDGKRGAELSDCELYRYRLRRVLDGKGSIERAPENPVTFVMLNPSTATASQDDPTIRRCMRFARDWGHTDLLVANLFAYRATDPAELEACHTVSKAAAIGPGNDEVLMNLPAHGPIVCAWGGHRLAKERGAYVLRLIGRPVMCLSKTKAGAPGHPLYLPADSKPIPYWNP